MLPMMIAVSKTIISLSRLIRVNHGKCRSVNRLSSSAPFGFRKQRPPGGGRVLTDPSVVFEFNNWDNVQWDEEQEKEARDQVASNSSIKVADEKREDYEQNADRYWDGFYSQHQNRFFKDRHWLFTEFPELAPRPSEPVTTCQLHVFEPKFSHQSQSVLTPGDQVQTMVSIRSDHLCNTDSARSDTDQVIVSSESDAGTSSSSCAFPGQNAEMRIFEVGCGVGNTVVPVLQTNNDPGLFVYGCDLSSTAVELLKEHKEYSTGRCHAFVCDIADSGSQLPFPDGVLDVIVCIFVLSAINPHRLQFVANRLSRLLKPGGIIVFRDYGRYDLTQLRFKTGRCLGDNFYVRGDGTKVYFFTQDELRSLFVEGAGLVEEQNLVDRRLQVNRGRQIKMYRVWIQCKFRKPLTTTETLPS